MTWQGFAPWWCGAAACLVLAGACRPLPPRAMADAGPVRMEGVRLERLEGARQAWTLEAPRALLALDGDAVTLEEPQGWVFLAGDGGAVAVGARSLEASLAHGRAVARDAWAQDGPGRRLNSPALMLGAYASVGEALGPAKLSGPNHTAVAAGGARLTLATQEVELLGPVEAATHPPDGGGIP